MDTRIRCYMDLIHCGLLDTFWSFGCIVDYGYVSFVGLSTNFQLSPSFKSGMYDSQVYTSNLCLIKNDDSIPRVQFKNR